MTQEEALAILKAGLSVLVTGPPGSGKTHTAMGYVRWLRAEGIDVAVTASTGIAATHLGGITVHSWSGIGIKQELSSSDLDKIKRKKRVARQVRRARVLVIDEISMLSSVTLGLVDRVCRKLRERPEPFGGLQVVLVGDFFQLPPIPPRPEESPSGEMSLFEREAVDHFAFQSPSWEALDPKVCYLTEQHRQEDDAFLELLVSMRNAAITPSHVATLESRCRPGALSVARADGVTQLFSHNVDVDRINDSALRRLPGGEREYLMERDGPEPLTDQLVRGCASPERLVLRQGARVMFTRNNFAEGYVNGTTGTVVGFSEDSEHLPVVKHSRDKKTVVEPAEWTIEVHDLILARVVQVPLRLAWAITVHKSQGMSLDSAHVDLTRAFAYGQGYVALSRLRTLDGLTLSGFNRRALQVDPGIQGYDKELLRRSASARTEILGNPEALARRQRAFLETSGGISLATSGGGLTGSRAGSAAGAVPGAVPGAAPLATPGAAGKGPAMLGSREAGSRETVHAVRPSSKRPWTEADDHELASRIARGELIEHIARSMWRRTRGILS